MNVRNFIKICLVIIVILWLALSNLPYRLSILENAERLSYDNYITSQEYLIRKKQEKLAKAKSVSTDIKLDAVEELANVFWGTHRFSAADQLLEQVRKERKKLSKGSKRYDEKLVNTMISLAGLYRDMNEMEKSQSYYDEIWDLDKANLPNNDLRLARDQSSLAVVAYIRGARESEQKKRTQYLKCCLEHINNAQNILQNQTSVQNATLANLLYLKYLAFRELGDKAASDLCRRGADYLTKKLKRPCYAHWS